MTGFVESIRFSIFSAAVIVANAVLIGVEIEIGRIDVTVDERVGWYDLYVHGVSRVDLGMLSRIY